MYSAMVFYNEFKLRTILYYNTILVHSTFCYLKHNCVKSFNKFNSPLRELGIIFRVSLDETETY
jgi:hypothetical protein